MLVLWIILVPINLPVAVNPSVAPRGVRHWRQEARTQECKGKGEATLNLSHCWVLQLRIHLPLRSPQIQNSTIALLSLVTDASAPAKERIASLYGRPASRWASWRWRYTVGHHGVDEGAGFCFFFKPNPGHQTIRVRHHLTRLIHT